MRKFFLGSVTLLALAFTLQAGELGLDRRISLLEENTSSINAMLARQRADIANLQSSIDSLASKVDALAKAQNVTLSASSPDWAGNRTFTATGQQPAAMMPAAYSMGMGSYSSGGCAGGSCGTSRGRGLFGRR